MKYRLKTPIIYDAFRLGVEDAPEWFIAGIENGFVQYYAPLVDRGAWCKISDDITESGEIEHAYPGYVVMRNETGGWRIMWHENFYRSYQPVD